MRKTSLNILPMPSETTSYNLVTERKIVVNNLEIHVRIKGNAGNALLFIHGSSSSSGIWEKQFSDEQLLQQYQLIAIDLPGHGQSSHATDPAVQYRFSNIGECISGIIDILQLKSYILTGLSIGCNIIGEIAGSLTGCKGFFLAGAALTDQHTSLEKITLPFIHGAALVMQHPSDEELKNYCSGLLFTQDQIMLADVKKDYRQTDPAFRANLGNILATRDWGTEVANLNDTALPTALVYGEQEEIVNTTYLHGAIRHLWRNNIILVPNAGHFLNVDQPALFNELLSSFASAQF